MMPSVLLQVEWTVVTTPMWMYYLVRFPITTVIKRTIHSGRTSENAVTVEIVTKRGVS